MRIHAELVNLCDEFLPLGHVGQVLEHDVEVEGELLAADVLSVVRFSLVAHRLDLPFEELARLLVLTKLLELLNVQAAQLVLVHN